MENLSIFNIEKMIHKANLILYNQDWFMYHFANKFCFSTSLPMLVIKQRRTHLNQVVLTQKTNFCLNVYIITLKVFIIN